MIIDFTIRATSEAAFKAAWVRAGILEDTERYVLRPVYDKCVELSCLQGWPGIITNGVDEKGDPIIVPGWHCNARVTGALAEAMTAGLPQYDENGNLLPLMQRTWALYIFGLVDEQSIDPLSKFPYLAKTVSSDVQYGDPLDLKSPSNVRQ